MSNIPVSYLSKLRLFPTEQAAAIAALNTARDEHPNIYEWGGFIVKSGDSFSYTDPVTIDDNANFAAALGPLPANTHMVAIYHTHPSLDPNANKFSPNDVIVAKKLKCNSYIWCENDNTFRLFQPGYTPTYDDGDGDPMQPSTISDGVLIHS